MPSLTVTTRAQRPSATRSIAATNSAHPRSRYGTPVASSCESYTSSAPVSRAPIRPGRSIAASCAWITSAAVARSAQRRPRGSCAVELEGQHGAHPRRRRRRDAAKAVELAARIAVELQHRDRVAGSREHAPPGARANRAPRTCGAHADRTRRGRSPDPSRSTAPALPMRVLFLTHYYPPEAGAAQTRLARVTQGLARDGLDVAVHAPPPHYPAGAILAPYRNRPLSREWYDGVEVFRTPVYPHANRGFAGRLANHLSFATSAERGAALTGSVDVVVAESPPLFTAAAGAVYARLSAHRSSSTSPTAGRPWPLRSELPQPARDPDGRIARALLLRARRGRTAHAAPMCRRSSVCRRRAARCSIPPAVDLARFSPAPLPRARRSARSTPARWDSHRALRRWPPRRARRPRRRTSPNRRGGRRPARARWPIKSQDIANVEVLGPVARAKRCRTSMRTPTSRLCRCGTARRCGRRCRRRSSRAWRPDARRSYARTASSARIVEENGAGVAVAPEDPAALARTFERLANEPGTVADTGRDGAARGRAALRPDEQLRHWQELLERVARG